MTRMARLLLVLGPGLLAPGCGVAPPLPVATPPGGPNGTLSWNADSDIRNPVPGIDQGAVFAAGKSFVVWGDSTRGAGGGSGSSGRGGASGEGYIDSLEGHSLEFAYDARDDGTGSATVDGVRYDLAAGNLLLVRWDGRRYVVRPLRRNLEGLALEPGYFKALAGDDAEIRDFFAAGAPTGSAPDPATDPDPDPK